jgi:TolA-binding protein
MMRRRFGGALLAVVLAIVASAAIGVPAAPLRSEPGQTARPQQKEPRGIPRYDKSKGPNTGLALYEWANQLAQRNRCDEAIPLLEELVEKYPEIGTAPELLSGCYLKAGRPQEAIALLERFIATRPDYFPFIRDLGLAYLDLGRREEAVAAWRRALKPGEQYGSFYGMVAKLEQEAGLYEEAIATYRAGTAYRPYMEHYTNEIMRLERILGRHDEALRELFRLMIRRDATADNDLRSALAIYRDAQNRERLFALADSAAGAAGPRSSSFGTLKAVFLIEDGRPGEAATEILGDGAARLGEGELYSILGSLAGARREESGGGYGAVLGAVGRRFLEQYPDSPYAPAAMLTLAENARQDARFGDPPARQKALEDALSLAEAARAHRAAAPYAQRAMVLRAEILLEDLHRGDEALRELDQYSRSGARRSAAVMELRMRALLASADRNAAERQLAALAADPDSNMAIMGAYGLGELAFRKGSYSEASKAFSELAEKHPASAWANDALETALSISAALREGRGALDIYRAAVIAEERGERTAALDSLVALDARYPESALAPRALFVRADILAEGGDTAEAAADFEGVAERFAEHELAPRALERLAAIAERHNAALALERYGAIMERYPQYPFVERVRARYVALGKSRGTAEGAGNK